MKEYAITAIGEDRPGIVAGVTEVLYDLGCNLADCSMSLLRGQFAMILLIEAPEECDEERLNVALEGPAGALELGVSVRPVPHAETPQPPRPYVVSIYGADHPGIVYRVARTLAGTGVNITDLRSHLLGESIYAMVLEIDLPEGLDETALEQNLRKVATEIGVEVAMRAAEASEL